MQDWGKRDDTIGHGRDPCNAEPSRAALAEHALTPAAVFHSRITISDEGSGWTAPSQDPSAAADCLPDQGPRNLAERWQTRGCGQDRRV
jgi:hypothetical protein